MKGLARHQVRATRLGLPLQMCEPKSPGLLAQGARGDRRSCAGVIADNTRLIREEVTGAGGTISNGARSDLEGVGCIPSAKVGHIGPRVKRELEGLRG